MMKVQASRKDVNTTWQHCMELLSAFSKRHTHTPQHVNAHLNPTVKLCHKQRCAGKRTDFLNQSTYKSYGWWTPARAQSELALGGGEEMEWLSGLLRLAAVQSSIELEVRAGESCASPAKTIMPARQLHRRGLLAPAQTWHVEDWRWRPTSSWCGGWRGGFGAWCQSSDHHHYHSSFVVNYCYSLDWGPILILYSSAYACAPARQ